MSAFGGSTVDNVCGNFDVTPFQWFQRTARHTLTISLTSTFPASLGFLSDYLPQDRKILAVYPIGLFYTSLAFLILAQNKPLI